MTDAIRQAPLKFAGVFTLRSEIGTGRQVLSETPTHAAEVLTGPIQLQSYGMVNTRWGDSQLFKMVPCTHGLPDERYLLVTVPLDSGNSGEVSYASASLQVAEVAARLGLLYPGLVAEQRFEGVLAAPNQMLYLPPSGLEPRGPGEIDPEQVRREFADMEADMARLAPDERARFRFACRWYVRGMAADNLVDRLLYWYFSLEVHPAHGTSAVARVVGDYLHHRVYPNLSAQVVKQRLGVGAIAARRNAVVHDGLAFVRWQDEPPFAADVRRLGAVVQVCLRLLVGVPHGGLLDEWVLAKGEAGESTAPESAPA